MTDTLTPTLPASMADEAERFADGIVTNLRRSERLYNVSMDRACDAAAAILDEIRDMAVFFEPTFTVTVHCYGGGPAGGIEFTCKREYNRIKPVEARAWHQDWWKPVGYSAPLDDDTMEFLWETWGVEHSV